MVLALVNWIAPTLDMLVRTLRTRRCVTLLAICVGFIVLHAYVATQPWDIPGTPSQYLRVDQDHGVSEYFEYLMLAAAAFAAWQLARTAPGRGYAMVTAALVYLFLDDAFEFHEVVGALISPSDSARGEQIVSLTTGVLLLGWWLTAWRRTSGLDRTRLEAFAILFGLLAFFGVAVDAFHATLGFHHPLDGPVALLEDGGELLAIAYLSALVLEWRYPSAGLPAPGR